jgi:hypothetical protein
MPEPLKLSTIQPKPKEIVQAPSWRDIVGLTKRPELKQAFDTILRCIRTGRSIPQEFYRANRDSTPDELLDREDVMHLHLGNPGTRELLYLIQYDDYVILLEVSDHYHFETDPPGTILNTLHGNKVKEWVANKDKEMADQQAVKANAVATKNLDIRSRLGLPKKTESVSMREWMNMVLNPF